MSEQRPLRDYQRMWDLVRQMRVELYNADLITDDEYAALAVDHPAVARLESYDELRSKLRKEVATHAETREQLEQARKVVEAERYIRHWHDTGRNGEGMIVSAEKVRELWNVLDEFDAAIRNGI